MLYPQVIKNPEGCRASHRTCPSCSVNSGTPVQPFQRTQVGCGIAGYCALISNLSPELPFSLKRCCCQGCLLFSRVGKISVFLLGTHCSTNWLKRSRYGLLLCCAVVLGEFKLPLIRLHYCEHRLDKATTHPLITEVYGKNISYYRPTCFNKSTKPKKISLLKLVRSSYRPRQSGMWVRHSPVPGPQRWLQLHSRGTTSTSPVAAALFRWRWLMSAARPWSRLRPRPQLRPPPPHSALYTRPAGRSGCQNAGGANLPAETWSWGWSI